MKFNLLGDYGKMSYFGTNLRFAKTRLELKNKYAIVDIVNEIGFDSVGTFNWWCIVLYVIVITRLMNEILAAELYGY